MLLVGQAHVTLSFQRRLNVLARVLGYSKKAMDMLRTHENKLSKDTNIFGADFFKSLVKKAKFHKEGANIRQELGTKRRFKTKFKKPFRQGAPRGGFHEGHRSVSGYRGYNPTSHMSRGGLNNNTRQQAFKPKQGNRRYVLFSTSVLSRSQIGVKCGPTTSVSFLRHVVQRTSNRSCSIFRDNHSSRKNDREIKAFSGELAEINTRQMGLRQCKGAPNRIGEISKSNSSPNLASVFGSRKSKSVSRGRQIKRERCGGSSKTYTRQFLRHLFLRFSQIYCKIEYVKTKFHNELG